MSQNNQKHGAPAWFKHEPAHAEKPGDFDTWETWTCPDPVFSHEYDQSVVIYVLEGSARLQFADGQEVEVKPGDKLTIKQGAQATWHISPPITNRYRYGS